MRLFGIISAGLLMAACGLSMNPDLPSASGDNESGGFPSAGDGDISIGNGDGDGIDDVGGVGGLGPCEALGGAGGLPQECEASR